jgi:hypothetical protein
MQRPHSTLFVVVLPDVGNLQKYNYRGVSFWPLSKLPWQGWALDSTKSVCGLIPALFWPDCHQDQAFTKLS